MKHFTITDSELIVMNAVWDGEKDKTLMEVLDYVHEKHQRYWKSQTVSTFLKRLIEKGYVSYYRVGRQYYYHPQVEKQECFQSALAHYNEVWECSRVGFLGGLISMDKFDDEEINYLKQLLEKIK